MTPGRRHQRRLTSPRRPADAADTAAAWDRAGGIAIDRIWVQGLGDDSVMAFTDFGVESLVELIKIRGETTPTRER